MKKLRRTNLSEDAYSFVKALLLSGERYRPGEKISVEALSRDLGVSRTPVWGAINRLEAEGVVEIAPRQGVYLISFDPAKALDIYIAREALEGMAARLAAERGTKRQVAALKTTLERQQDCLALGDADGYTVAAMAFHERIVEAAANESLARLLASVYAQIQAMRARSPARDFPTKMPTDVDNHERIFDAIAAGDPAAAEYEARAHIHQLRAEIERRAAQEVPLSRRAASA